MQFRLTDKSTVYLICLANYATGGTEVIHQFAYKLGKLGFPKVRIFYLNRTKENPIHENFRKYRVSYCSDIEDRKENILIVPEIYTHILYEYKHIQKSIWWLSVDNYFLFKKVNGSIWHHLRKSLKEKRIILPKRSFSFTDKGSEKIIHLYQSEYARLFLEENGVGSNKAFLSDYISPVFSNQAKSILGNPSRANSIIYNPFKGLAFTKKILEQRPDLNWVPIQKMSPEQVQELLSKSKVYLDFGHHPGKDRLPREAVLCGCCIITGKKGAAANPVDVPIPEEYKFDENTAQLSEILDRIDYCLTHYSTAMHDFDAYRKKIASEEQVFEDCIKEIFILQSPPSQS